jgi:CheY-like chemotaxis protein
MELSYNVLWLDDEERIVKPIIDRLENHLKNYGLDLTTHLEANGDNLVPLLKANEFDLILVDLNLEEGVTEIGKLTGENIIKRIRQEGVFTDVIFYSRVSNVQFAYSVEGTYFADTNGDNFIQRIKQIIDWNLNRRLNIAITRGTFIATTIDLAKTMEDIITKILRLEGEQQTFFEDSFVQTEIFNDMAKYNIIKDFLRNEIEKTSAAVTAHPENAELIKTRDDLKKIKGIFNGFNEEVIDARNTLAHSKAVEGQKNTLRCLVRKTRTYENITYNLIKCKDTRELFGTHLKNLEAIARYVDSLSGQA